MNIENLQLDTLETNEFGLYTEETLDQLEDFGLVNVVSNNVYYFNEDAGAFIFCGSTNDYHKAVVNVLQNLGYDIEE